MGGVYGLLYMMGQAPALDTLLHDPTSKLLEIFLLSMALLISLAKVLIKLLPMTTICHMTTVMTMAITMTGKDNTSTLTEAYLSTLSSIYVPAASIAGISSIA